MNNKLQKMTTKKILQLLEWEILIQILFPIVIHTLNPQIILTFMAIIACLQLIF